MRTPTVTRVPSAMTRLRLARRLLSLGLIGAAALGPVACSDSLLVEAPPHIIVPENLYTDLAGFEAGLNALYAEVRREREGWSAVNDIRTTPWTIGVDNGWGMYLSAAENRPFTEFGARNEPLAATFRSHWIWLYRTINSANTIIGRAENPAVRWSEADRNRVVAEARLIRAWAYRHLTYMWGDVPLNLEESSGTNVRTDWVRTPRAEVRAQMEQDLLFAEANLPELSSNPGKVVKAVAQHYLAELYLAMDRPADAEAKAAAVVNGGTFSLVRNRYGVSRNEPGVPFMDMFKDGNANRSEGNTEALWVLQFQQSTTGGGASLMRRYWVTRYYDIPGMDAAPEFGGRGIGRQAITRWALNLYEPTDDRGSQYAIRKFYTMNEASSLPAGRKLGDTVWTSLANETTTVSVQRLWPSTMKWDWTDPLNPSGEEQWNDQVYLRLADTYLLLAEAYFEQGKMAEAAEAINAVRTRSNATPITAAQVTLDFILDERSRELVTEEHRRYTLLRTGTWLARTRAHNRISGPVVAERDTLFPIPQSVIDANLTVEMAQNPGY